MHNDIQNLYADVAACLMAIRNLLTSKGLATHEEFVTAFQERLLTLQAGDPDKPYLLVNGVARGLMKPESDL